MTSVSEAMFPVVAPVVSGAISATLALWPVNVSLHPVSAKAARAKAVGADPEIAARIDRSFIRIAR
jgi:hypothetical protein